MCKKDEQETKETILTIEEAFERLDALTQKLENGQTSLEESFAVYQAVSYTHLRDFLFGGDSPRFAGCLSELWKYL